VSDGGRVVGEVLVVEVRTLILERLRRIPWGPATESAEFGNVVGRVNVAKAGAGVIEAGEVLTVGGADHQG
jgi:hypothetical protein